MYTFASVDLNPPNPFARSSSSASNWARPSYSMRYAATTSPVRCNPALQWTSTG